MASNSSMNLNRYGVNLKRKQLEKQLLLSQKVAIDESKTSESKPLLLPIKPNHCR